MHSEAVAEELSSGHKTAFAVVCGIISLCSIVGNVFYLYSYIRDSQLKGCFHLLVANIAVSDILFSVVMVSLNIVVLYNTDVIACAAYRTLIFLLRQEVKILLVLISVDRVHLIKGVMKYRQSCKKRTAAITVTLSWLASTAFAALYASFMFVFHGDYVSSDNNLVNTHHCHAFYTVHLDYTHLVQLVLDVLILVMYGYVLMLCRKTQHAISSMHMLLDRHSPDESQLQPREDAAYNLHPSAETMVVDTLKEEYIPHDLEVIPEERSGCISSIGKGPESMTPQGNDNDPTNTRVSSQDGNAHQDRRGQHGSVLFAPSSAPVTKKKTGGVKTLGASPGGQKDLPNPPSVTGTPTRTGDDAWPYHPVNKSLLHALLAKPTASGLWRSDAMAAQQLGVFLCLHVLLSAPSNFANFIASVAKVDMTGFVHWLDWLTLLRGAVFPIVYCFYSCRLRGHLDPRLCPCFKTKVTPSRISRLHD
ncbi:hypothetical protein V1264_004141 [Littorina saxatilis]|uniref:G-protein coupled receptors family 1 profile domain-containing protein n=1 Tax=Littorina saxatilis TaxID=31220 RepID=A0AAN9B103_9CAEN